MFDCGKFVFAISNQMHGGLGIFKIIRIDEALQVETMYKTIQVGRPRLEYIGQFVEGRCHYIIASGSFREGIEKGESGFRDLTYLFKIDEDGKCEICNEWEIELSSTNSLVVIGDFVYLGQNRMVTRLNWKTGEINYYTNKKDEELQALTEVWLVLYM